VEVFGTQYGFFSAVALIIGGGIAVFMIVRLLIKGKVTADIRGNKFVLGQDETKSALAEIKEALRQFREEFRSELLVVQLDLWEQQIRDSNIPVVQRAKIFGKYEAKGGKNRDLMVYFDSVVKPMLEKYYLDQNVAGA
jgi:hypothetical protein